MNVIGLDIGYSNLKLAFGDSEEGMTTAIRPAGAAPADRFGSRYDGKAQDDFLHVLVDEEPFVAGVSSDQAALWERSLHAEYSNTQSYKALFHAGLLMSGMSDVDMLVTGLPVHQYKDEKLRAALEKKFVWQAPHYTQENCGDCQGEGGCSACWWAVRHDRPG